jgi:hypothetical protein
MLIAHVQVLDDVRFDLAGQAQPLRPTCPTDQAVHQTWHIRLSPGEASGAMTGVELADVMARAQAHSRGHGQLPQVADRDLYQAAAAAQPPPVGIIRSNECPGAGSARREGNAAH